MSEAGGELYIHPSSVLFGNDDARLLVSISIVETTKVFARDCQKVDINWIFEVAPQAVKIERTEPRKSYFSATYTVYERVLLNGGVLEEKEMPATPEEIAKKIERDGQLIRADVFTNAVMGRVFSEVFHEIDAETQEKIDVLNRKVETIILDPEIYGYRNGGFGLRLVVDIIKSTFRRGDMDQGEKLLADGEDEVENALKRAAEILKKREERAQKEAAIKQQEAEKIAEREKLKTAWQEYQERLGEIQEKYKKYPGWGVYVFPVSGGLPQDYRGDDGKMYSFDQDFFEVLPEKQKPCWGYVTQWGHPTKVALVLEVVEKPK